MILDDAIKHCEEVAEQNEKICDTKLKVGLPNIYYDKDKSMKCSEEHRQLAEWLKHYKKFRECMSMYYNGKIDKDKCFEMLTDMFTENGRRKEEE